MDRVFLVDCVENAIRARQGIPNAGNLARSTRRARFTSLCARARAAAPAHSRFRVRDDQILLLDLGDVEAVNVSCVALADSARRTVDRFSSALLLRRISIWQRWSTRQRRT